MLKELRVRNFAIIESVDVEFADGLNILTGETGAGKSIIVGALGLALGQRAFTEMIKTGADEATVEAVFDSANADDAIAELGLMPSDEIIVRRVIARSGKSKAFINDTMVSVQGLAALGRRLVDMHGQHEHQSLLSPETQMDLIDQFGRLDSDRQRVREAHDEASRIRRELDELKSNIRQRAQQIDLLSFQATEIAEAALHPGEDRELESRVEILSNIGKLRELVEEAYSLLYSAEGSSMERLSSALGNVREMSAIDQECGPALKSLEEASALVEDAAHSVRSLRDKYEMDPSELNSAQERLELINALKRKYGKSVDEVLAYMADAERRLEQLRHAEEATSKLEGELAAAEEALKKAASKLTAQRKKAAAEIQSAVKDVLKGLAFSSPEFRVDVRPSAHITASGADEVEFMFSANKGEDAKPMSKVASGGELSRLMLAIKTVLRAVDPIPTLIFDEVDAGIGGKTAQHVAERLKESAASRQVLCITHLPQIASKADAHYLIDKQSRGKKTAVTVSRLGEKDRQAEIARMLSGSVTDTSLEHAKEILSK